MSKSKLFIILAEIAVVLSCCFSVAACGDTLSQKKEGELIEAYTAYWQGIHEGYEAEISVADYAGKYDGNMIALMQAECDEIPVTNYIFLMDGSEEDGVVVINGVEVCFYGDSTYCLIVYTKEKQVVEIEEAYSDGIITDEHLYELRNHYLTQTED